MGQDPGVEVDVEPQPRVQLVPADPGQVVPLGIEEELLEQGAGGVHRGRLARALLLEQLDQGALLGLGLLGVGGDRVPDVDRVVEHREHLLVGVAHRPQQDGDRELALAVDPDEDPALLVDLELEPGATRGHQVGREELLVGVLGRHHIGAGRADQLGDHDPFGPVDHEGAPVGHPGEIAHEDGLLADLPGLAVLEGDLHVERTRVGEVALATLLERVLGIVELDVAEDDRQVARVVLDRRDVGDRRLEHPRLGVGQRFERAALYVDQMWGFERCFESGETATGYGGADCTCQGRQLLKGSGVLLVG